MLAAFASQQNEHSPEPDLAALVRRVAAGDEDAFAQVYDRTCTLVHSVARRILSENAAAEEVTADVFTQVWKQAANYQESKGAVLAWLTNIVRSRAIDRLRSVSAMRQRFEPIDDAEQHQDPKATPEEHSSLAERRRIVQEAMRALPREQREAIEVAFFQGMTHTEVAQQLGQPLGTVKTRIRAGMMKLRELLAPLEEVTR